MIHIVICDNNESDRQILISNIKKYACSKCDTVLITELKSSNELFLFCDKNVKKQINLLFYNIKNNSTIEEQNKKRMLKIDSIKRIIYMSFDPHRVYEVFSKKTIGFLLKPVMEKDIKKWIECIYQDDNAFSFINLEELGSREKNIICAEDILYCKADGNYSDIYVRALFGDRCRRYLLAKSIGFLETKLSNYSIVRSHKSYLVNVSNIKNITTGVLLNGCNEIIPIGRAYSQRLKLYYYSLNKKENSID